MASILDYGGEEILSNSNTGADRPSDLGGVFVLSPRSSEVDRLADQISHELVEQGVTLESMLAAR